MIWFSGKGSSQETQVDLVGGLGNQLFGYAAGKYLEQVHGHRVVYNTWHIPRGITDHNVSVEGRLLEGTFRSVPPGPPWAEFFQRNFRAGNPGWNAELDSVKEGTRVKGYFQTWRYNRALRPGTVTRDLLVKIGGPSSWLQESIECAKTTAPFVLHFRRGDYLKVQEIMGLLGRDYYSEALGHVEEKFGNPKIWIFSDDVCLAKRFFKDLGGNLNFVTPPPKSDPAESLILMTYGQGHIISNSTFAWWGASLSPTSELVIAPSPWLKGLSDPQDLYPAGHRIIQHNWVGINPSS